MKTITRPNKAVITDEEATARALRSIGGKIQKLEPNFRQLGVSLTSRPSSDPDAYLNSNHGNVHCKLSFRVGQRTHRINFSLFTKDWSAGKQRRNAIFKELNSQ